MKPLNQLVTNISIGIDRINFSIPRKYRNRLLEAFYAEGTKIECKPSLKYWHTEFDLFGTKILVSDKIYPNNDRPYYDRTFVCVSDPDEGIQQYLKSVFDTISRYKAHWFDEILINQIEVSYDFFIKSDDDIESIKQFIDYHLVLKYARNDSYKMYYETRYIGTKGNTRKGSKGQRSYPKEEHGKSFFRFEMQYNRPYLKQNHITIEDLPLNPLSFQTFDHVLLLDNLSNKGVKNISRSILKKENIIESSCPDFNKRHHRVQNKVRFLVLGDTKGSKHKISEQIEAMKDLIKDNGLKIYPLDYFPSLDYEKSIILCHADIGYEETNCTKRMVFCQR